MDIGQIRKYFREWLSEKLRIDVWGLGSPSEIINRSSPPSLGVERPVTNIDIGSSPVFEMTAIAATIPFAVVYRFDRNHKYADLPRDDAESLLTSLIAGISLTEFCEIGAKAIEASGKVEIAEDSNSDWLVIFEIDIRVEFDTAIAEPKKSVFTNS